MRLRPFPLRASPPQRLVVISALSDSTGSQLVCVCETEACLWRRGWKLEAAHGCVMYGCLHTNRESEIKQQADESAAIRSPTTTVVFWG